MRTMTELAKPAAKKGTPVVDWERLETQYRINTRSLREIAAEHGITESAIRKRATRDDWGRDLSAKVRTKSDKLVRKDSVRTVRGIPDETPDEVLEVEIEAQVQARIRISHRTDIARSRKTVMTLLDELDASMTVPNGKKAPVAPLPLAVRVTSMRSLADSLRVLIECERKAYGLDDGAIAAVSFEDRLKAIANV